MIFIMNTIMNHESGHENPNEHEFNLKLVYILFGCLLVSIVS